MGSRRGQALSPAIILELKLMIEERPSYALPDSRRKNNATATSTAAAEAAVALPSRMVQLVDIRLPERVAIEIVVHLPAALGAQHGRERI